MVTITTDVEVDVYLDDFSDKEIIEEMKERGYRVDKEPELDEVIRRWNVGDKKEALFLLERAVPGLYGISKLI